MKKLLFIDRDGTLVKEPEDEQVDTFEKIEFVENVIPALLELKNAGYAFIMVTNQDGLGTPSFPNEWYEPVQAKILSLFKSQGIEFNDILVCPHFANDNCDCRKPKLGLVKKYMTPKVMDFENSYVIGDRDSDLALAQNMNIRSFRVKTDKTPGLSWLEISKAILYSNREATITRNTKETNIEVTVNLDIPSPISINTGLGFFDHMLDQLAKHSGISMSIAAKGDLHVDEHHLVEDVAICIGAALKKALGDKFGVRRYAFSVPMDEASASTILDLSGRPYLKFSVNLGTDRIGEIRTTLFEHFFRSLTESLGATVHIKAEGTDDHHKIEAVFKSFANTLKEAIKREQNVKAGIPSTKGSL